MKAGRARLSAPTLAALTCAHILRQRGWHAGVQGKLPDHTGAILLRPATAQLLCTLWGDTAARLLHGAHRLRTRRVRWGGMPETVVEQAGLVVALAPLLAALQSRMATQDDADPDWIIAADESHAAPLGAMRLHGTRRAWISQVKLAQGAAADEAVLEQYGPAWFMLLPRGGGQAVLHSIALDQQPALPEFMSNLVARIGDTAGPFPAMARLRVPASRPGLIAIGEAAMALDPLCGDGAGHALRGAWAVAEALGSGAAGLRDYDTGLGLAFQRHAAACAGHYAACGGDWKEECYF